MLKLLIGSIVFFLTLFSSYPSLASVKLLTVSAKPYNEAASKGFGIELEFDGPVSSKKIKTSSERNFIQISLDNIKIDSAKIVRVPGSTLDKVFAYSYSPEVTRVRLLFKDESTIKKEIWKTRISNLKSKIIKITVTQPSNHLPILKTHTLSSIKKVVQSEETPLLKEVILNTRDIDIQNPDSVKEALRSLENPPVIETKSTLPQATNEPSPIDPTKHFVRMIVSLFVILGLFLLFVFLLKKYAGNIKKLPFGKKERLIQVVATHYLGHKKSISLVKVTGEYMVVGTSNDGVSLITKLGADVDVEKYLEDRFWGGTFEKHLGHYSKSAKNYDGVKDLGSSNSPDTTEGMPSPGIRASIKEKLSRLKPL